MRGAVMLEGVVVWLRLHAPWVPRQALEGWLSGAAASEHLRQRAAFTADVLGAMNAEPGDVIAQRMADEYVRAEYPLYGDDRDYGDYIEYGGGGTSDD